MQEKSPERYYADKGEQRKKICFTCERPVYDQFIACQDCQVVTHIFCMDLIAPEESTQWRFEFLSPRYRCLDCRLGSL